jgi:hypothetical protein
MHRHASSPPDGYPVVAATDPRQPGSPIALPTTYLDGRQASHDQTYWPTEQPRRPAGGSMDLYDREVKSLIWTSFR